MFRSLAHNLLNLWRLTGRDDRQRFWPWAMVVAVVATVALGLVWLRPWLVLFGLAEAYRTGEWGATLDLAGDDFGGWAEPATLFKRSRAVIVIAFLLVLPGMVRRLHDAGRSGLWIVPVPVFAWMATAPVSLISTTSSLDPGTVALLFVPMIAGMGLSVAIMILGVLLLIEGDAGANRFGAPAIA